MDITTFRWILIVAGIAILAGIFLFGRPDARKRRAARPKRPVRAPRERREPTLGDAARERAGEGAEDGAEHGPEHGTGTDVEQPELDMDAADAAPPRRDKPVIPPPEKIVTLYLLARDNHKVSGVDLLDAALKAGLEFGPLDVFHRKQEGDERPVFSMANISPPGRFDHHAWNTFETPGVTLFLTLPGPMPALDAWDAMLATARNLGERLHADILDDAHSTLTRQRSAQIREDMRQFDRKHEIAP